MMRKDVGWGLKTLLLGTLLLLLVVLLNIKGVPELGIPTAQEVRASIVSIQPTGRCDVSSGTGFFFAPQGYILTASHAVKDLSVGQAVTVQWTPTEGAPVFFQATIIDKIPPPANDIAVLQIQDSQRQGMELPWLPVSAGPVADGTEILVIGFPAPEQRRCTRPLIVHGEIGAHRPPGDWEDYDFELLEITMDQVQPGSSGSPVISEKSEQVVGILIAGTGIPGPFAQSVFYLAVPVNVAIEGLSHNWLETRGFLPPYVLAITHLEFPQTVIAGEQLASGQLDYWALLGNLNRVRFTLLEGEAENLTLQSVDGSLDPRETERWNINPQGRKFKDIVIRPSDQHEGTLRFEIASLIPQKVRFQISPIDEAGNPGEPVELELEFIVDTKMLVIADFEGQECTQRRGRYLLNYGSTPGEAFAFDVCMEDPADSDTRGNVIREEYDVSEESFPNVPPGDLYSWFWLQWRVEDFHPEDYDDLCVWLRGGDPAADPPLGFPTKIKIELKIQEWGQWNWRYYYLEPNKPSPGQRITEEWQHFCVPLSAFKRYPMRWPQDQPNEFVVVFENQRVDPEAKQGVIWLDEVAFRKRTTPPAALKVAEDRGTGQLLDLLQRRAFLFFWERTDERGLTIESTAWPIGSIASGGFFLTSVPIAIERGWVRYEEGRDRVLTALRSYSEFVEREHGFFPHWFVQSSGKWSGVDVFSSIDTSILMAGILTVRQYFSGLEGDEEQEIVRLATQLYEAVDWDWMANGGCTLSLGWRPDQGFHSARWTGYNEGMLGVLLALSSPTHPISQERCSDPWQEWARSYRWAQYEHDDQTYSFIESTSTSLFTYQYPQIWFDLREKKDELGVDYFENSRTATLENRAYTIENPNDHEGYGPNLWGLTASECPLHATNFGAHGPRQDDDGTIAPTGAISSIVFTPEESIAALQYMYDAFKDKLWGRYGFRDALNLDLDWFSPTYIGIDQGAMLTMIENHRSGLVWSLFMLSEYAKKALEAAGFTGQDTTPPAIVHGPFVAADSETILAKVEDNVGLESVALYYDDQAVEMTPSGSVYAAPIPPEIHEYRIEARDVNGNVSVAEYDRSRLPWVETVPALSTRLPEDAPPGSQLIENFDDCIARHLVGAWYGGTSRPQDVWITFDGTVNHSSVGCSLKITYRTEPEMYNGAWIKFDGLDLSEYEGLVFWVKGDQDRGYTTTFKVELKSPGRRAEYVVEGVTDSWKRMAISFSEFDPLEIDWSNVTELTVVFEHRRVTDPEGAVYLDDLYFAKP